MIVMVQGRKQMKNVKNVMELARLTYFLIRQSLNKQIYNSLMQTHSPTKTADNNIVTLY
jgi:hypothetical protein